jgi:hypothetical protein
MSRMKLIATIVALVILATTCACSDTKHAPQGIDADGTIYVACSGFVTISGNMQEGYEIRFTDASGLDHDVRGIHRLEVADLPDAKLCAGTKTDTAAGKSDIESKKNDVSEACKQARANGTAMKWNEHEKKFDINPECEE